MDSPPLHLCTVESTDDKFFKSISLYPLTSTPVSVFSSELPGDSSVETWSFIFIRENLSGWSPYSLKSSESAFDCSSEGPGFDRSIDHWFSRFCLRLFRRFLLSTRSRKSFNSSFLPIKASLFLFLSFSTKGILYFTNSTIRCIQPACSVLKYIP